MVASLMTLVGLPKAFSKSKPAHPVPRLTGSYTGLPSLIGAGQPTATWV